MKTEYETVYDYAVQNDTKPLWLRSPKEVTKDEYDNFFKGTFREFLEPAAYSHFNVEGTIEFTGLLFIPGMAPFEQGDPAQTKSRNIRLYVKRVFISDEFDDNLMPRYLQFIKGIVDSSDLPLNVSREILQVRILWVCFCVGVRVFCVCDWGRGCVGVACTLCFNMGVVHPCILCVHALPSMCTFTPPHTHQFTPPHTHQFTPTSPSIHTPPTTHRSHVWCVSCVNSSSSVPWT